VQISIRRFSNLHPSWGVIFPRFLGVSLERNPGEVTHTRLIPSPNGSAQSTESGCKRGSKRTAQTCGNFVFGASFSPVYVFLVLVLSPVRSVSYAHGFLYSVSYVLCPCLSSLALCPVSFVPCPVFRAPCLVSFVPCPVFRAPYSVSFVPCPVFRAPYSVFRAPCPCLIIFVVSTGQLVLLQTPQHRTAAGAPT
jgi:hypothetical protein